jgi:hypothetical protein
MKEGPISHLVLNPEIVTHLGLGLDPEKGQDTFKLKDNVRAATKGTG